MDALDIYARAGETGDADLLMTAYADRPLLRSPIFGRLRFRRRDDLRTLMTEVYGVVREPRFGVRAREGRVALLTGSSRVWGARIEEAFVFELDADGRIERLTVHVRPLPGLVVFAAALGLRMARHPGVLWRAAR